LAQAIRRPTHPRPRIERERTPWVIGALSLFKGSASSLRGERWPLSSAVRQLNRGRPTASTFLRSSSSPNSQRYEAGSVRASRLGPRLVSGRPARRCR
jgi:hypothetical protein